MKLSIIIPVFNEEKTIAEILRRLEKEKLRDVIKEIIIVNDGSTDKTSEILHQLKRKNPKIKLIEHKRNLGKGSAVRSGIETATGDYVLIQDADLEYHPNDIINLITPIKRNEAQVVYGTRLRRLPNFLRDERTLQFFTHYLGNRFLSLLTSILYGQWLTDIETGYKVFPRHVGKQLRLRARSFDFEPEITAKLLKNGYKILEVNIKTIPRGYEEGKKLHTVRDGLIALWTLIKFRFIN